MLNSIRFSSSINAKSRVILFLVFVFCYGCKTKTDTSTDPIIYNYLFGDQIGANVKLPTHDTTNAFSYISGEINGEKFSIAIINSTGNDSIEMYDGSSKLLSTTYKPYIDSFYKPSDSTFFPFCSWGWLSLKKDIGTTSWSITINSGLYDQKGQASFLAFKKSFVTPGSILNMGCSGNSYSSGACWGDKNVEFMVGLNTVVGINSEVKTNLRASSVDPTLQTSSTYFKVLSVNNYPNGVIYRGKTYRNEITYGFDCFLNGNSQGKTHITNGKAKVWSEDIKF